MTGPDDPTAADLIRLRRARLLARAEVAVARSIFGAASKVAFRRELVSSIRCASPFLVSLLTTEQLSLADVVDRIEPTASWPNRPRLFRIVGGRLTSLQTTYHAMNRSKLRLLAPHTRDLHSIVVPLDCGGVAEVRVVAHSLEVRAVIRNLVFETRFGELRIATAKPLPLAITASTVGRLVDDVVGHATIDGRGWRVRYAENTATETVFVISTGVVPWRVR